MRAPAAAAAAEAARLRASPQPWPRASSATITSSIQARTPVGMRKMTSVRMPTIGPSSPSRATNRVVAGEATISATSPESGGGRARQQRQQAGHGLDDFRGGFGCGNDSQHDGGL